MREFPLLRPIQQSLLIDLIEAEGRVPLNKRIHFRAYHWQSSDEETALIQHPGFEGGHRDIFLGDLTVLSHSKLISLQGNSETSYQITIQPEAYLYYGMVKQPITTEIRADVRGVFEQELARAKRALQVLNLKVAGYGSLDTPVHIVIDLEDKRAEIAELELYLDKLSEESESEIS